MLFACWTAKGGSGATVVAAALAQVLAGRSGQALLVDLRGDLPAALGVPEPTGPGCCDWLAAAEPAPPDALARLEVEVAGGLRLLPSGPPPVDPVSLGDRAALLATLLATDPRPVVVDCGRCDTGAPRTVAAMATVSLLVIRPCYLALRHAAAAPLRPSGVVLVEEPGRALGRDDVEQVVGAPVRAVVAWDPAVARRVDAGMLGRGIPRGLARALRHAA